MASNAGEWEEMKAPFALEQGQLYSASIVLNFVEKAMATQALILNKFAVAGFVETTCTADRTRVYGRWGKADAVGVTMPSQVRQVWRWREAT